MCHCQDFIYLHVINLNLGRKRAFASLLRLETQQLIPDVGLAPGNDTEKPKIRAEMKSALSS
jgi:hypothetical protein